ncbi:MAG: hypothetical protein GJU76_15690 [Gallionella sp.]|nr:hypothetical protein [Gallionella sp.]
MNARALTPFVIRHGRVGDMIMQTALSAMLHRRFGAQCQIVGAGPWNESLIVGNPDIARCWTMSRHAPFALNWQWPRLVHALHRSAPGPIYVAEYQYRQLPRVRRILRSSGIDMNRCVFIDEKPGDHGHWVDALFRLGARTPAALSASDYPPIRAEWMFAPQLFVLESERRARDAWLRQRGWSGRAIVLVQPGNHRSMSVRSRRRWRERDDKSWPLGHWRELLGTVREQLPDALIVLRGAVGEIPVLEMMRRSLGIKGVEVLGQELRAFFALLEVVHSVISVDTGPAHAAAALGAPVLVLFGGASQEVWLPRGRSGMPVLGLGGPPERHHVENISVREVIAAWGRLLSHCTAAARASVVLNASGECREDNRAPCRKLALTA